MSEKWYPIIVKERCDNCGYCIDLCPNEVFDKSKSPEPFISYPGKCVEGCKYCGVMCTKNAIKYFDGEKEYFCNGNRSCSYCL